MSTAAAPKYGKTFQQTWLSDQGAWPIISILGGEWQQQQHRQIPRKVRRRSVQSSFGSTPGESYLSDCTRIRNQLTTRRNLVISSQLGQVLNHGS